MKFVDGVSRKEKINYHLPNILERCTEISLTQEEAKKRIVYKYSDGTCDVLCEDGEINKGAILSLSSNGSVVIGILQVKKD